MILEKFIAGFFEYFLVLEVKQTDQPRLSEAFPVELRFGINTPLSGRPQWNKALSLAHADLEVVAPPRCIQGCLGDLYSVHVVSTRKGDRRPDLPYVGFHCGPANNSELEGGRPTISIFGQHDGRRLR